MSAEENKQLVRRFYAEIDKGKTEQEKENGVTSKHLTFAQKLMADRTLRFDVKRQSGVTSKHLTFEKE